MKKQYLNALTVIAILVVACSSRVWGGSSIIITIIGDTRNSAVKARSIELNYLLQQVRASGKLREYGNLWNEFRVYDMARERDRTICINLGVRDQALPVLSVLSINLFGEPQRILWKMDGSDTVAAIDGLMGFLKGQEGVASAVKPKEEPKAGVEKTGDGLAPEVMKNPVDDAEMRCIPAGVCVIGSPGYEGDDDEHPQHKVTLGTYYIYTLEVTNGQFAKFIAATGYSAEGEWDFCAKPGRERHPVVNVTWNDARAYCTWAGGQLPTEAQWEKAARGEKGFKYPWGNEWNDSLCNWRQGPGKPSMANMTEGRGTVPGGSFPEGKSPFGIMDMSGNVAEWVADWYDESYYSKSPQADPQGPESGEDRIIRGGSWEVADYDVLRGADRVRFSPNLRLNTLGFRVVKPVR